MVTDRQKAILAILSAIPAFILACSAWVQADAARKREAATYQQAGEELGAQSDELLRLQAKVDAILAKCDPGPRGLIISGNQFEKPGVANILVREPDLEMARRHGWKP